MYHTKIGGTMEDFFDKLQDKILIIDYSGKILFCNKTLLNQLQYQLDDLDNIYNLIINSNIKFNTIDINCNKEYIVDILTKNNIDDKYIRVIYEDSKGNYWIGCFIDG